MSKDPFISYHSVSHFMGLDESLSSNLNPTSGEPEREAELGLPKVNNQRLLDDLQDKINSHIAGTRYLEALPLLREKLSLLKTPSKEKVNCLGILANCYRECGKPALELDTLIKISEIIGETNPRDESFPSLLHYISKCSGNLDDWSQSVVFGRLSLEAMKSSSSYPPLNLLNLLGDLSIAEIKAGQTTEGYQHMGTLHDSIRDLIRSRSLSPFELNEIRSLLLSMSDALVEMSQPQSALIFLEELRNINDRFGASPNAAVILRNRFCVAKEALGDLSGALEDWEHIRGYARMNHGPDSETVFSATHQISEIHSKLGDQDSAERVLRSLENEISTKIDAEPAWKAITIIEVADACDKNFRIIDAESFAKKAFTLLEECPTMKDYEALLARLYSTLGDIEESRVRFDVAEKYYLRSVELLDSISDPFTPDPRLAFAHLRLSNLYRNWRTTDFYIRSTDGPTESKDILKDANWNDSSLLRSNEERDPNIELDLAKRSLGPVEHENRRNHAIISELEALLMIDEGDIQGGLELYEEIEQEYRKLPPWEYKDRMAGIYIARASVATSLGNSEESLEILNKAKEFLTERGRIYSTAMLHVLDQIYKCSEQLGVPSEELDELKQTMVEIRDEMDERSGFEVFRSDFRPN